MTIIEIARTKFNALDAARIAHEFHNGPVVNENDYSYQHGHVMVCGHWFNRDQCFGYQPTYDGHYH